MRKAIRAILTVSALPAALMAATAAQADKVFNVSQVTTTGGNLSGTFTTNDALSTILTYSITTPATGAFSAFTYNPADSIVSASTLPSQYFRIDTNNFADELQFYFASGLTSTGGLLLSTNSYEHQPTGGNRFLSGIVSPAASTVTTAVPEATAWAMMMVGLSVVGGSLRRRQKVNTRVSFA